jgi:hypothetical protein
VSPSVSPSPSPGWQGYTRGDYAALPTNDNDLETAFSASDLDDVSSNNAVRVSQSATGEYAIFQFKDYVGSTTSISIVWDGQSTVAPTSSKVVLQIYDQEGGTWETLDEESAAGADTDFQLTANVSSDMDHYVNAQGIISCRVYQLSI